MKLTITCEKVYMKKRIILSLTKKTMVIHNPICKKNHHLKTLLNLLYVWASVALCNRLVLWWWISSYRCTTCFSISYVDCFFFSHFEKENVVNVMHFLLVYFVRSLIEHIMYSMNFEIKLIYIYLNLILVFYLKSTWYLVLLYAKLYTF